MNLQIHGSKFNSIQIHSLSLRLNPWIPKPTLPGSQIAGDIVILLELHIFAPLLVFY